MFLCLFTLLAVEQKFTTGLKSGFITPKVASFTKKKKAKSPISFSGNGVEDLDLLL